MWHSKGHFSLGFSFLFCKSKWIVSMSFIVKCLLLLEHITLFPISVRTFGTQTVENSTQNGLGKNENSILFQHPSPCPPENPGANPTMDTVISSGLLSDSWLLHWCWVHLQTPLVVPSQTAALFVRILTTPDSAALKPWMCLRAMFLALPAPQQVGAHPWTRPHRQRHATLWFTRLRSHWRWSLLNPWRMEREWGRGNHVKKNYVPVIKRRANMQWKGMGRDICYNVFMQAVPAAWKTLFLVTVVNTYLSFKIKLKKTFTEPPEIPIWLLYSLSNIHPIFPTNTHSTPMKVQSTLTLTFTKELEYQALCAYGMACWEGNMSSS